jgi:hypothetical protein
MNGFAVPLAILSHRLNAGLAWFLEGFKIAPLDFSKHGAKM